LKTIGAGVMEIRIHAGSEYRVFYVATLRDAVHVLHAFVKKTQKTRQSDIKLAATRYRDLLMGARS
jgi:phage-related protein